MRTSFAKFLERSPEQEERDRVTAERRIAEEAAAEARRRRDNFAKFIGDRRRYADASLEGFKLSAEVTVAERQRRVVDGVREFIAGIPEHHSRGIGLIIYGPPGVGKDHLATTIVRSACLDHGHRAAFLNGPEFFITLRDAMDSGRSESAIIGELAWTDWLVLSDPLPPFGELTPHQAAMLLRLADERNARRRPTIVTINVADGEEAAQRMGAATWDRLRDSAWAFPCSWPSFRVPMKSF